MVSSRLSAAFVTILAWRYILLGLAPERARNFAAMRQNRRERNAPIHVRHSCGIEKWWQAGSPESRYEKQMSGKNTKFLSLAARGFQVEFHGHAKAILSVDFPEALDELGDVLSELTIPIEEIVGSGGGETKGTQRLRRGLTDKGWTKTNFEIKKTINGLERESISHEVDHVRSFPQADNRPAAMIALEIEWNNKDPFFDRDLENFKRLHAEGAISAGIIVTRGEALQDAMHDLVRRWIEEKEISSYDQLVELGLVQTVRQKREVLKRVERHSKPVPFRDAWTDQFVSDKFGTATTHWSKLAARVQRGVGNPCPLVLIGLPPSIVTFGEAPAIIQALIEEGARESN